MEWALLTLLLLVAGGLTAHLLSRSEGDGTVPELAAASAYQDRPAEVLLETDDPQGAAEFVLDEFGYRVTVPDLPEAALRGVAAARVAPSVEVPVLLYDRANGPVRVYVYSYALLDQTQDRLRLADADYDGLVEPGYHVLREMDGQQTLLWRSRDDLFVAVADEDLQGLASALFAGP